MSRKTYGRVCYVALALITLASQAVGSESPAWTSGRVSSVEELRTHPFSDGSEVVVEGVPIHRFYGMGKGLVLHDGEDGIWISTTDLGRELLPGTRYRVRALVRKSSLAGALEGKDVFPVGDAALPMPVPADGVDVASGRFDCQFVSVTGVVRTLEKRKIFQGSVDSLTVLTENGIVELTISDECNLREVVQVDDLVRCSGVVTMVAQPGRSAGAYVAIPPDLGFVEMLDRPAPIHSSGEALTVDAFRRQAGKLFPRHRLLLRGRVIAISQGKGIFLRDETGAIEVQGTIPPGVTIGSLVTAAGFFGQQTTGPKAYQVRMEHGEVLLTDSPATPQEPRQLGFSLGDAGAAMSDLVTMTGEVETVELPQVRRLTLKPDPGRVVVIDLAMAGPEDVATSIRAGAVIRVSGIFSVDTPAFFRGRAEANFSNWMIRVRDASDIEVLKPGPLPPRTRRHLWIISLLTTFLAILAGALAYALRRIVVGRRQAQIAAALDDDRERIARNLHDSLAHGLTAAAVRLSAADDQFEIAPNTARSHLLTAREQIRRSLSEAGKLIRTAVDEPLPSIDLESSLQAIADELSPRGKPSITIDIPPAVAEVSRPVSRAIYLIAREALTNAIRHAASGAISIAVDVDDRVHLRVRDDGVGFDPEDRPSASSQGLSTMQARAELLGGNVSITSATGKGSLVVADFPATPPQPD